MCYAGIALGSYNGTYEKVTALSELQEVKKLSTAALWLLKDAWYANTGEYEIPVAENVQVYMKSRAKWVSGEEGLKLAVEAGTSLDVYYDRTVTTGGQIRVIVVASK